VKKSNRMQPLGERQTPKALNATRSRCTARIAGSPTAPGELCNQGCFA
jgi:hypothetical protein